MEAIRMTISDTTAERISLLYRIAKSQGSLVSVSELVPFMPEETSESELESAINSIRSLNSRFQLKGGYLTERFGDSEADVLLTNEAGNRTKAGLNFTHALRFLPWMRSISFSMVAVGGSTSYRSASRSSDLDFFCVTPAGRLWLPLTQGLILSRVYNLLHRNSPPVCFSCMMDDDFATRTFEEDQGPLFARDALEARVVRGGNAYRALLSRSTWMQGYYPHAYSGRMRPQVRESARPRRPSILQTIGNSLLFRVVGAYIRTKSRLFNQRLARAGRRDSLFAVKAAQDHLMYESERYEVAREAYSSVVRLDRPQRISLAS